VVPTDPASVEPVTEQLPDTVSTQALHRPCV